MEINQIVLSPTISIPKSNFDFLIEATHNEQLYLCCLDAERKMMTDYDECLKNIRKAIEALGVELEKWYRAETYDLTVKEAQRSIYIDLKRAKDNKGKRKDRRRITKKNFFVRHIIDFDNKDHEDYTRRMIHDFIKEYQEIYPVSFTDTREKIKTLKDVAYDMYARCSVTAQGSGAQSSENCRNLIKLFRQLLCLINYVQEPYDISLTPMDMYFPIPEEYYEELGLIRGNNVKMYVSEDGNEYFLLKRKDIEYLDILNTEEYNKRLMEINLLCKMWEMFLNSPGNIRYVSEEIGTPEYRRQVFRFIGKPHAMTKEYIDAIDKKSRREELVRGLIRAMRIMHGANPSMVHRWLNPECIYVCEDRRGITPFIVKFERPGTNVNTSSIRNTSAYFNAINLQKYIAPEIRNIEDVNKFDGKSADIYSLGKLVKYIYGRDEALVRDYVEQLIVKDPGKRPDIVKASALYDDEVVSFEPTIMEGYLILTEFRLLIFTRYNGFENYIIDESVSIGRMANTSKGDIKVDSPIASRSHGQFIKLDTGFAYMDMNSTNGTFINGVLYGAERSGRTDMKRLSIGDIIRIDNPEFKKPHRNAVLMFVLGTSNREMSQKSVDLVNGMDIYVGRDEGDIRLSSNRVSKRHARFVMKNNVLYIQDVNSTNGVFLNGKRIEESTPLSVMDAVRIEDYIFIVTEKKLYYYAE